MANAKLLPSGKWRVLVYIGKDENGKKKYKSITGTDKRKCEREAAIYADQHRDYNSQMDKTFKSAVEEFIASRKSVLSPSTLRGYECIKSVLTTKHSAFCNARLTDITTADLQNLINDMASSDASPKTIRNRYALITATLAQAGISVDHVALPSPERHEPVVATVDMVKNLLSLSKQTDNGMYVPVALAAMCGMRRSEIVGLDISDIDKSGNAHIRRATVIDTDLKPVTKGKTKTYESDRYVRIPSEIVAVIKSQGYVCQFDNPERISERFSHLVKRLGYDGLRFHDLRHFWVSHLHSIGISDAFIMEHGGWRTDVMKRVYRHRLPDMDDAVQKVIDESQKGLF